MDEPEIEYPMDGRRDQNPPGMGLWALLREDRRTHGGIVAQGFWAVAANRVGNWAIGRRFKLLRAPAFLFYRCLYRVVHWTCAIELPYIVKTGRRVRIWHHGGNVLGARAIGDDVQIRHNVTFGLAGHGAPITELPLIEDRVVIGCGACILGKITIGHDSIIGANAVVTEDVPPYSLVAGIPGRVVKQLPEEPLSTGVETPI
jgi:serine O-acetyltransferase